MNECFCTIISEDFKPMALTLFRSINKVMPQIPLQVLVCSENAENINFNEGGIKVTSLTELQDSNIFKLIYKKYAFKEPDFLRWALKPVYILHLLKEQYEKVCYVDCDIFFCGSHAFVFEELKQFNILLSPHAYEYWPMKNEGAFAELLHNGYFNAGFIACNRGSAECLAWWAEACLFGMGKNVDARLYDDQRYLDYFPILFSGVKIIKHAGCNLGAGSSDLYKRENINGRVMINGKYPLISIHFSKPMIEQIMKGYEPQLADYLNIFRTEVGKAGGKLENLIKINNTYLHPTLAKKIRWRLHIRTTIKKMLSRLIRRL